MSKYESFENLRMRSSSLYEYGHDSSVWGENEPLEKGHVIEIVDPYYVSKPCWEEICEAADHIDSVTLDLHKFIEWEDEAEQADIHQFFFLDIEIAKKLALRVQKSARNKRKDLIRNIRLEKAGGHHNKEVIERLFEIQKGRCYYSGDLLCKSPKNYVIDHIHPIYLGGTNWPKNLALVIKEINTWKGGLTSSTETLKQLAKSRGKDWLREQKQYCNEVDRERTKLDQEYRRSNDTTP